ncbi:NlpC/P60 family protein [Bavariicoccus seileri]|uniref:C40 family peptidase n=1 Tax=Bavariicoccus seileri TaxID=549685 RepID=UPI0003B45EF9|nr:C40 family peptidase [Bavariicoccus seileri]
MVKKSLTVLLTTSIITLSALAPATTALAVDDKDIENQSTYIDQLKNQKALTEQEISAVQGKIDQAIAKAQEIVEAQQELQGNIDDLKVKITDKEAEIEKREDKLAEQARAVQVSSSNSTYLEFILGAEDFSDVVSRISTVVNVVKANNDLVSEQKDAKVELDSQKTDLDNKYAQQEKNAYELEVLKDQLDQQQTTLVANADSLEQQTNDATSKLNDLVAQKETEERLAAEKAAAEQAAKEAAEKAAAEQAVAEQEEENTTLIVAASAPVQSNTPAQPASNPSSNGSNNSSNNNNSNNNANNNSNDGGSSNSGSSNNQASTPAPAPTPAPSAPSVNSGSVLEIAQQFIGVPYVWGGTSPSGFDCSGLVQYVYAKVGRSLPRVTYAQETAGSYISVSQAQPGDLLFWGPKGSSHHVAIYMGGGQYIHAPQPGQSVTIQSISYYAPDFAVRL